jgi:hypothetical protein
MAAEPRTVRPITPEDREAAEALLGDVRPFSALDSHIHVAGEAAIDSLALWLDPAPGSDEAYLGSVITPSAEPDEHFYELVLVCAEDALGRGLHRAYFAVKDRALLRTLQSTFKIDPIETGWEPLTGTPSEWEVHVDLRDAAQQLREVLSSASGSPR